VRRARAQAPPPVAVAPLVASGLVELAVGALAGFPFALAVSDPDALKRLGVRAPARIRQLHLDLIIMGGLVAAAGTAVPDLPRRAAVPLAIGAWTNALSFLPLAVRPEVERTALYRAGVGVSFILTSAGWVSVAAVAVRRLLQHR